MLFKDGIYEDISKEEEKFHEIRKEFHQIPELGLKEKETTRKICQYLESMGIEAIPFHTTGVMAYLGKKGNGVLALRADIDGLQVCEETGLPFASKYDGFMHACGHDGHIAGLLGAAQYLKRIEESLPFQVKLIFQPSEENTQGAKAIIEEGVLEDVDAIFGLHLFSDLPCGSISVDPGPRMAQTDRFTITFRGKGGHAGKPHLCVDSTVMASEFVLAAQPIVSREVNPVDPAVVTIGSLHSGTQYNIISPQAVLQGTCRSFSVETARLLQDGLERKAKAIAMSYGGEVEISYEFGSHPPLINPEDFTKEISSFAESILGRDKRIMVDPFMLGEDFSCYQDYVPGVFAFVGCGKLSGESYPNHHPKFDIEPKALVDAVALHLAAVEAFAVHKGSWKKK